jgi:hypothetical protein
MRRKTNAKSLGIPLLILLPIASLAAPAYNYPLTGTVLEAKTILGRAHAYKIETDTSIYKLLCYRHALMVALPAECTVNGKPLATGDEVHLRTDGKTIFLEAGNNKEHQLSILLEEAKILPPLLAPSGVAGEGAVLLARGLELSSQSVAQSTPSPVFPTPVSSTSTIPSGPVIAIPATGGAPVLVTPTSPVTGGVVTGINTATGQPVTGISTSPINTSSSTSPSLFGSASSSSGPAWMAVLYLQTESHIYKVACAAWSCAGVGHQLALGDLLVARISGKWAYVSSASASGQNGKMKESKFRVLSVTSADDAPSSQPL